MIDIKAYLLQTASGMELDAYLFDRGFYVALTMKNLLMESMHVQHSIDTINDDLLLRFGPLLITDFKMTESSVDKNLLFTQSDASTANVSEFHAMLLIGVRKEGRSYRFLLQNWWRHLQFLEMDKDTLVNSDSRVFSIHSPQFWFKEGHPVTNCKYGEF